VNDTTDGAPKTDRRLFFKLTVREQLSDTAGSHPFFEVRRTFLRLLFLGGCLDQRAISFNIAAVLVF
jgi:hypothetical protein